MGITHSMDEAQVARVSKALKGSADAIQGINSKFEIAETHYRKLHSFQGKLNRQVEDSLDACARLEDAFHSRAEGAAVQFQDLVDGFTDILENMVCVLQGLNIQREVSNLPKAMVPLMIPLVILLIELAVANAYLGILIASMPEVREKYSWCSPYLLGNASCVLFGLTISLVWLAGYRIWLSCKSRSFKIIQDLADEKAAGDESLRPPADAEEQSRHSDEASDLSPAQLLALRPSPSDLSPALPPVLRPLRPMLKRSMSMPALEARCSRGRSDGSSGELLAERLPGSSGEVEKRAEQRAVMARQRARVAERADPWGATSSSSTSRSKSTLEERLSDRRRRNTRGNREPSIRREQWPRRSEKGESR